MHPTWEFPIEQLVRHRGERFQYGFALSAKSILTPKEDFELHACSRGLVIRGRNEDALGWPVAVLRDLYGDQLEVGRPEVRFWEGELLHEPIMHVRVVVPPTLLDTVEKELRRRGVDMEERYVATMNAVLRGHGPLARLIGLPAKLAEMTNGTAQHWITLSHYAAVEPDPGGGVAA